MFKKILAVGLGIMISTPAFAMVYDIDPSHTTFGFGVKHLVVSTTKGEFRSFSGIIEYDPKDLGAFKADVTINVNSIDTRNTDRDKHLKSADFFDADNFPRITFKKAKLVQTEVGGTAIVGELTIKDVTQNITIPVEVSGPVKSPMGGGNVIGIAGEVVINRQDFHMAFNKAMEAGGLIVDNNVKIVFDIEAHEQKPEPAKKEVKAPAVKAEVAKPVAPEVKAVEEKAAVPVAEVPAVETSVLPTVGAVTAEPAVEVPAVAAP